MQTRVRTIGMIGGIAPPSTIDYYQRIISRFQERTGQRSYPPVLINSINMAHMIDLVNNQEYGELVEYLLEQIWILEKAGAKVIFFASNTPHVVFNELADQVKTPMISIVNSTIKYVRSKGYSRLGLFGTISTMEGDFYQEGFEVANMEILTPMPDERKFIHKIYMEELVKGRFVPETKNRLLAIANRLIVEGQMEALILGGTELPFILKNGDLESFEIINTTKIHVESILDFALR